MCSADIEMLFLVSWVFVRHEIWETIPCSNNFIVPLLYITCKCQCQRVWSECPKEGHWIKWGPVTASGVKIELWFRDVIYPDTIGTVIEHFVKTPYYLHLTDLPVPQTKSAMVSRVQNQPIRGLSYWLWTNEKLVKRQLDYHLGGGDHRNQHCQDCCLVVSSSTRWLAGLLKSFNPTVWSEKKSQLWPHLWRHPWRDGAPRKTE